MLDIKQRITSLQSTTPEKTGNKKNPKRDIHGSPQGRGSSQDLLNKLVVCGRKEGGREARREEGEQGGEHGKSGSLSW